MKAVDVLRKWTPEIHEKCEKILANAPEPELDWKTFTPVAGRRVVRLSNGKE